ncbi:MAG TPA: PilN domain-containing protein [Patescibacteria group bacterium]|nr:PilN domain-containing protein [Patescibacteria group bacterium]
MLFLNLLPSEFSQELKFKNLFRLLVRAGTFLVVAAMVIAASFFIANKILRNFYEVVNNTNFLMQTQIKNPIEVREVNVKIKEAGRIRNNSFAWLRALEIVSQNLPRNVYVESLELNKEEKKVTIDGVALTRESLVYLKENLENSDNFSELKFPLENILKKKDIHFEVEARINTQRIKKN